jgi:hypothetical protein
MKLLDARESMTVFSRRTPNGLQIIKVNLPRWEHIQGVPMPYRTWAVVTMQAPDGDGFPIDMERQLLEKAEVELLSRLPKDSAAAYMGSITHRGQIAITLQSKNGDLFQIAETGRVRGSRYVWDIYTAIDPQYEFLQLKMIPSLKEQRRIRDAEVLGALAQAKDNDAVPRPLTFYGLFPDKPSAEGAADYLTQAGYRVKPPSEMPGNKRYPFSLMIQKTSQTDAGSIEAVSAMVGETVTHYGGIYDGWSCEPVPG